MPAEVVATPAVEGSAMGARWGVLAVCFFAVVAEGVEIVCFGVAAPDLRVALGFSPQTIGVLASICAFGATFGAFLGGRSADLFGSKRMLFLAFLGSMLFTLGSGFSHQFASMFVSRLLVGIFAGVILPIVIAIAAEAGGAQGRVTRVSIVTAGLPAGGVVMGVFGASAWAQNWPSVFWFATFVPALVLPFLALILPPDRRAARPHGVDAGHPPRELETYRLIFFRGRRGWATAALWISGFSIQLIVYLLLNWLPTLMRLAGATRPQGATAMTLFSIAGLLGGFLFGGFMQLPRRWLVPLFACVGIVAGLLALLLPGVSIPGRLVGATLLGACAIGSQLLIYGYSAETYEKHHRGTGVGAAAAVGRVGMIVGPLGAGLAVGATAAPAILLALLPLTLLAGAGGVFLARRRPSVQTEPAA